ncbi:AfsR/SARP family transcriptional regulator, partial [Streptomyces sp. YIM 98790]|uniref:AfsR/SARP family transcriptional regulator n=1 Tax=Streptomyces sp. YIM 98790 TaxID=2689077 RepID=UPI00140B7FF1
MGKLIDTVAPTPAAPGGAPEGSGLWISMLGPLGIRVGGRTIAPGPLKQQLFLAALLARPGRAVSLGLLTETIWQDAPPRTARKNLQVYASTLRRMLGPGGGRLVEYGPGGYLLRLDATQCDSLRFAELAREAAALARSGDTGRAAVRYRQALDLWRHEPLAPLADHAPLLREAADRWHERHLEVYESWAETRLAEGDADAVAATIAEPAARHPLRERLRVAQLRALHRCGRRSEALAVYDDYRRRLSAELGLAPGAPLERAYRSLLDDDAAAEEPLPARPPARSTVSVVRPLRGPARAPAVTAAGAAAGAGR